VPDVNDESVDAVEEPEAADELGDVTEAA